MPSWAFWWDGGRCHEKSLIIPHVAVNYRISLCFVHGTLLIAMIHGKCWAEVARALTFLHFQESLFVPVGNPWDIFMLLNKRRMEVKSFPFNKNSARIKKSINFMKNELLEVLSSTANSLKTKSKHYRRLMTTNGQTKWFTGYENCHAIIE